MGIPLPAHTPLPSLKENKYFIQVAVATLYEACSEASPYGNCRNLRFFVKILSLLLRI